LGRRRTTQLGAEAQRMEGGNGDGSRKSRKARLRPCPIEKQIKVPMTSLLATNKLQKFNFTYPFASTGTKNERKWT